VIVKKGILRGQVRNLSELRRHAADQLRQVRRQHAVQDHLHGLQGDETERFMLTVQGNRQDQVHDLQRFRGS
jgi:hypothetical protein